MSDLHPFEILTPSLIMDAVEDCGFECSGHLFPLNSYENRVYQVGIEDKPSLIVKFYRPHRWTVEQILEEHEFGLEMAEQELPMVAPLVHNQQSLQEFGGFHFAIYPQKGGHAPELDNLDNLYTLGKLLGRMHNIGGVKPFKHRPTIDSQNFGHDCVALISEKYIPADLKIPYDTLTKDLMQAVEEVIASTGKVNHIRVHGDCHSGNILWREGSAHFVDLDDARMAPAIQDIWMLLSGDQHRQKQQLSEIVDGYNQFYDFHPRELRLIEVLRTLRIIHYAAWLAKRWDDPAFPLAFPWFNSPRYWSEHILELREQFSAVLDGSIESI